MRLLNRWSGSGFLSRFKYSRTSNGLIDKFGREILNLSKRLLVCWTYTGFLLFVNRSLQSAELRDGHSGNQ